MHGENGKSEMKPRLHIKILHFFIHSFHFFGAIGFIAGTFLGVITAKQLQLGLFPVLLMALVGAIVFFALTFLVKLIFGKENIVYYHHEITIMLVCAITLHRFSLPVLPYLDITLLGIGVFLAFGRIGCYSVGCCHGRPWKHGVRYGQKHVDAGFTWYYKDVSLLPVQLIESVYVFLIVVSGVVLLVNHAHAGTVLIVYTVIYGLFRYILEFFRGDPERSSWYGLSEAQWTTIILIASTFIFAQTGWLPKYNWHLIILLLLLIVSVIVIFIYRKKMDFVVLGARHMQQLAEGLDWLTTPEKKHEEEDDHIPVYKTKTGLLFSYGENENLLSTHYTISSMGHHISKPVVTMIARQIALLKNYQEKFTIIQRDIGIYHVLFEKNSTEYS